MPEFEQSRRERLQALLIEQDVSAALVTDLTNVRYLTGFTGSSGALLVALDGPPVLVTDSRYELQAGQQAPDVEPHISRGGPSALLVRAAAAGLRRMVFEDRAMTVDQHRELATEFDGELVPDAGAITRLRIPKDRAELALLADACAISDDALASVLASITVGVTEQQVARRLDDAMRDRTTEGPGFETIVATGPNSAIPHHSPTPRSIATGDLLKIDFGARVGGYHADMTRTFVVGRPPQPWQREIHEVVLAAQQAGRDALEPDAAAASVDRAARSVIEAAGWGEHFGHGLGHGVGLQIHEAPFLGSTSTDRLGEAVPVTVEPGIYLPGRGGVRIEDTVVVHHDRVELLTSTPRELVVLG